KCCPQGEFGPPRDQLKRKTLKRLLKDADIPLQPQSCRPAMPYCERGTCGPPGACFWSFCFSVSSRPGPVGVTGVGAPGCEIGAEVPDKGDGPSVRLRLAIHDSSRLVAKNPIARNAVVRVNRFAVPRLDMNPLGDPTPSPPPSERCSRTTPISAATIIRW